MNVNKLDNLEEMHKFLEAYNLSRLNQEEIDNLNRSVTSSETESVIIKKKTSNKLKSRTNGFKGEIYQTYKSESIPIVLKLFQKTEEEGTLLNAFYKAIIILIPKPDKGTTNKENYKPVSLMNVDAKIFNKILAN